MKRLIDFSSRFKILKGGKVSLVVSAIAIGSLVNVANASVTISTNGNYDTGSGLISTGTGTINGYVISDFTIDGLYITNFVYKEFTVSSNDDTANGLIFDDNSNVINNFYFSKANINNIYKFVILFSEEYKDFNND